MGFGAYPEVSLARARELRLECRRLLAENKDPLEHKKQIALHKIAEHKNTLQYIADSWIEIKAAEITTKYAEDIYNSLQNHIFPYLGKKPLHLISAPETIQALQPLAESGKLELVKRICQRLNMIMDYAVNTGVALANPLSGISKAFKAPKKKNLPAIGPDKLPALLEDVSNAAVLSTTRCLLEWQLHTMTRPSEAARARWDEMDFENATWTIPAKKMKMAREHIIPLTKPMLSILEQMRVLSERREYVFPSARNPRHHASSATVNMALRRMGYKDKLVSHGLRSLASTTLNEKGFDADIIETALAHQDQNSVRRTYNRAKYLEQRRKMMEWWSNHIDASRHYRL